MMSYLPPSASTYSGQIDWLFYLIYYVTTATFFAVQITLLAFAIKYRYDPNRRATYTHGNTTLEIIWTVIPAVMLAALALMSRTTWAEIKWRQPPSDFTVMVTAKQFNWEIAYPGPDGKFDTEDDVVMDNDLHVPVNRTVRVQGHEGRQVRAAVRRAVRLRSLRHEGVGLRPRAGRVRRVGQGAQRRSGGPVTRQQQRLMRDSKESRSPS
jgi:hypothetical protein